MPFFSAFASAIITCYLAMLERRNKRTKLNTSHVLCGFYVLFAPHRPTIPMFEQLDSRAIFNRLLLSTMRKEELILIRNCHHYKNYLEILTSLLSCKNRAVSSPSPFICLLRHWSRSVWARRLKKPRPWTFELRTWTLIDADSDAIQSNGIVVDTS